VCSASYPLSAPFSFIQALIEHQVFARTDLGSWEFSLGNGDSGRQASKWPQVKVSVGRPSIYLLFMVIQQN
jgi:hypothetical protein